MTAEAGIELGEYFDAAGPSNGPVMVLVHGAVVTRKIWIPQVRDLSAEYRVIAPDLPGHGSLAGVPFSLDVAAETVAEVIRECVASVGLVEAEPRQGGGEAPTTLPARAGRCCRRSAPARRLSGSSGSCFRGACRARFS